MNDNEEVNIVEEIVTLYVFLYILGYILVCIKLAEDLKLDSETPAECSACAEGVHAEHSVYIWPELD